MKGEENEDLEKLISRSKYREQLLEDIVEKSEPIMNFKNKENFLVLAREWNSWYPSTLKVKGGCYFFNINQEIIIIDPGFNTLEIIRKNELDVRQIRHIFVTHFHPDHFENLTTLITRLTSERNKLTVYLNSTTFKQFKIYSRGFTEFIELKPEFKIDINFELKEPLFKVNVKIEKAFHKEIGGLMNSVGLKFYIKYKDKKSHIIGFMSDTDGQFEYMEKYEQAYKDVDILVCHLGAIHKDPNGYKHLYRNGIESLLQKDKLNNKIIFIGEFGFELASDIKYRKAFYDILPSNMEYGDMIKILKKSIKFKEKSEEYYKFLIELLAEKFTEYITNIDDFSPCIEIILPFLVYGRFFNKSESPYDQQNIKALEKHFNLAAKSFDEEGCIDCWRIFLRTLIYGAFDPEKCEELLYNQFGKWGCFPIFYEFNELVSEFFNYFSVPLKNKVLNFIIKKFSRYPIIPKTLEHPISEIYLNETILSNLKQSVNLNSTKFKGIHDNIKQIFNSVPNKGFILLFFTYFIIRLLNKKTKSENEKEVDGRNLICDYLRKINNNIIIAVHPSYQVHFNPNEIEIKGKNRVCQHKTIIPIKDCNKNSQIIMKVKEKFYSKLFSPTSNPFKEDKKLIVKKKINEFVDIIPADKCDKCKEKG